MLAEELQNLDLDTDSSFTFQELAHFDREKLFELAFEKDQALEEEKFNFISLNQLMGLQESDGDKHHDEENKHDQQDPKMKQKDQLFSTLNEMRMSITKMVQLDTLGLSKSTIKKKRRQWKKLDS